MLSPRELSGCSFELLVATPITLCLESRDRITITITITCLTCFINNSFFKGDQFSIIANTLTRETKDATRRWRECQTERIADQNQIANLRSLKKERLGGFLQGSSILQDQDLEGVQLLQFNKFFKFGN